ncbi:hypothetical protein [Amycolatopsis eburnea]|uniref:Uncharacterized protein n=1 Tax=Amycolatopsis eburnea TaxID=2267691 RepID=A0A427SV09_9PSEU|nr:hypothetical protein [Amycolatopsis eburnea]RSD07780.1 hypothetical protein EIY87_44100 [Amycolatopsis eburnea]
MPPTAERDALADAAAAVRARRRALPAVPPVLTIGVLATYTIDPVEPYLRVALADADLPPEIVVGPFDQILPECLGEHGKLARLTPDALVVAPRWEDLPDGEEEPELLRLADAAVAAADRWESCLVFVLPALPQEGAGYWDGTAAAVSAARQRLRDRLAGRSQVLVADAESAVREVGALRAHHPALYAFARIPYTEEVFWRLGLGIARLLRTHFGGVPRVVVLGADLRAEEYAEVLRDPLRRLAAAGVRIGAQDEPGLLLTADPELASAAAEGVLLGPATEDWPAELHEAGVFDRPLPRRAGAAAVAPPEANATLSLEDFLAGLELSVTFGEPDVPKVTDLLARAKDFVLGPVPAGFDPAEFATAGDRLLLAASVRDRFGDHGLGAVAALEFASGVCRVEVFSISCPVMGRGVESVVLKEIVGRAEGRGCATVELVVAATGRNDVALEFAASAAETTGAVVVRTA